MYMYLCSTDTPNLVSVLATLNLTLATGSSANLSTTGNIVSLMTSVVHTSVNNYYTMEIMNHSVIVPSPNIPLPPLLTNTCTYINSVTYPPQLYPSLPPLLTNTYINSEQCCHSM